MSETVKAIISDSDQWHPEAECANHDPIPEGEFHYVMPKGARVVELTREHERVMRTSEAQNGSTISEWNDYHRFVSEWENAEEAWLESA